MPDIDRAGRTPGTNTGHGHVWPRPDGMRARCGGPRLCPQCRDDAATAEIHRWRTEAAHDERIRADERARVAAYLEQRAARIATEAAGTPHATQAVLDAGLLQDAAGWCRDDRLWQREEGGDVRR